MSVRKLRIQHNWSQEQLAKMSGLNVRTIQRVEGGESSSLETLKSLAAVFEVDIDTLCEDIKIIDKNSEQWELQPWWFRFLLFGINSRQKQIWAEQSLLVLGLVSIFVVENPVSIAVLFIASYITSLSVRYGDDKKLW